MHCQADIDLIVPLPVGFYEISGFVIGYEGGGKQGVTKEVYIRQIRIAAFMYSNQAAGFILEQHIVDIFHPNGGCRIPLVGGDD